MKYIIAIILFLATPSFSAPITIKSGEHENFTRLTLEIPKNKTFSIKKNEGGYEVSFGDRPLTFDLNSVYKRIKHDRFKDIRVDSRTGNLVLAFDCACRLTSEVLKNSLLVLDLHDDAPKTGAPSKVEHSFDWKNPLTDSISPKIDLTKWPLNENNGQITGQLLQTLANELAKGVSSGRLELSNRGFLQTQRRSRDEFTRHAEKFTTLNRNDEPLSNNEKCPPSHDYEIWNWKVNDKKPINSTKIDTQATGSEAFNQEYTLNMAKSYIYSSFGAEARQLLAILSEEGSGHQSLWFLSYIVDGEVPPENILENKQSCSAAISLWSILATDETGDLDEVKIDDAIQAFLLLPDHLQILHSQKMANFLISNGHLAAAEMIASTIERKPAPAQTTAHIVRAEVSLSLESSKAAERALNSISETDISLNGLIVKIDAALADMRAPDVKDVETLESLFFSENHSPNGTKLLRALSIGNALTGDFQRAISLSKKSPAVFEEIWELLLSHGQDGAFLREVSDLSDDELQKVHPNLREKTSQRLIDLGLPKLAASWRPQESGNAVLAAEISLGLEEFDIAMNQLADDKSDIATGIRTKALAATGRYDEAAELLLTLGNPEEAARVAKWNRNWDAALSDTDESWAKVALHTVPSVSGQGGTLKDAEEAADLAAQASQEISDLLQLTGID